MNPWRQSCDFGPNPAVLPLNDMTLKNGNYRTALWTGHQLQVTTMCIGCNDDIGLECHDSTDQMIYIVDGMAMACMGNDRNQLNYRQYAYPGNAIFIPKKTWHNVVNVGVQPLKLFSVYAPVQHPKNTIQNQKPKENA